MNRWRKEATELARGGEGPPTYVYAPDERTRSIGEKNTGLMVDPATGTVHLSYQYANAGMMTITWTPAVARAIGTALIEAALLASDEVTR